MLDIARPLLHSRWVRKRGTALAFGLVVLAMLLLPALRSGSASVAPSQARQAVAVAGLGAPDRLGYAVADVDAVRRQFAAATGTQFAPVTKSRETVVFVAERTVATVKLTRAVSIRGGPFIEFVKASRKIGPWAADGQSSTVHLSYSVDDVWASSRVLRDAGLRLVAYSGDRFNFWRGAGDILVRLVRRDLVPATGGVNRPQARVDLGPPALIAFSPCERDEVKTQLSAGLGFGWRQTGTFVFPFELRDGTVRHVEITVDFSVPEQPFILLETSEPSIEPFACPNIHLGFPVEDIPVVDRQVRAAGMQPIARGAEGLVVYYRGLGGIDIETVHVSIAQPPPP